MRLFKLLPLILLFAVACGDKKQTKTDARAGAEEEQSYDYREALQSYRIGINAINNGDTQEALIHLEKAIAMEGGNFRYRYGYGLALSLSGQTDQAIEQLEEALRIDPTFSDAHNLLGSIYTDVGKYDLARKHLREVIQDKAYSQPEFAYFNLGKVMRAQDRMEEAIAAYELASQLNPEFYRCYIALAEIYREKKDWEKMLLYYQKAEPNYPNDVKVLYNIGYALFRLKRFERSKAYLAQVSILFPPPDIDKPTQEMLRVIETIQSKER